MKTHAAAAVTVFGIVLGCAPPVAPQPYVPNVGANDFVNIAQCLRREVCSEIRKRGTDPIDLEQAASNASFTCLIPVAEKERAHLVSTQLHIDWQAQVNREEAEKLEAEKYALADAEELKGVCGESH